MTTLNRWVTPPADLALSHNEIHIWRVYLDQPASRVQQFTQTLSANERMRSERFYFEQDSKRFIVRRGILRTIIGHYLDREPSQLRFCYGPHGKPALAKTNALHFNLSHSQGLGLFAITREREVGVDLEHLRQISNAQQIAERFFSVREYTQLRALPESERQEAFFRCWTRKEAYVKAKGKGLSLPLNQFDVSLVPGDPARLLNVEGAPEEASRWSLKALTPAPGYVAALAVEGHDWRLTYWQFPESTSEVYQSRQPLWGVINLSDGVAPATRLQNRT